MIYAQMVIDLIQDCEDICSEGEGEVSYKLEKQEDCLELIGRQSGLATAGFYYVYDHRV